MRIHIENLRVRTLVGVNDWERETRQDVVINVELDFDGSRAAETDDLADTLDYKTLSDRIVEEVESAGCFLLETLCSRVLGIVLSDAKVTRATVRVDKPGALHHADSVAVSCSAGGPPRE